MNRNLFQYHPVFGYHFIPTLRARVPHEAGGYLIRVNDHGFRCEHEFLAARNPGRFRVLLFGDSYTAGDGVSNRDRYGDVLETMVPGLEVYNFGLPGSGTDQQYLVHRELAPTIEHDLVVIAVLVENIRRVAARYRPIRSQSGEELLLPKPYFTLGHGSRLDLHHVPVPPDPLPRRQGVEGVAEGGRFPLLRRLVRRTGPRLQQFLQRSTRYQPLPEFNSPNDPAWRLMRAILARWVEEARAPVLIMPIPLYQYVEEASDPRPYQRRFAEFAASTGVRIHDPLADLHGVPPADRRRFRFERDVHPTREGHRVLAASLAACIAPLVPEQRKAS